MTISRRSFLANSSAITAGLGMPAFLRRAALAAPNADQPGAKETVLVVVQLTGGNDGLNTVIPFRDPAYRQARPTLRQSAAKVKKINDDLGFHPSMGGCADLLEAGNLAILQGIGYPNPNRSHFSSMDIWHRASRNRSQKYGWLGRTLPELPGRGAAVNVDSGEGPKALFGVTGHAPSVTSHDDYQIKVSEQGNDPAKRELISNLAATKSASGNPLLDLVRKSAQATYESSERLRKAMGGYKPAVDYPNSQLANRLKFISQLITADIPERIYYTSHGGFDTHAAQAVSHGRLLEDLASGLSAFQRDLAKQGHDRRVLVMTFSEFGRRVQENGSAGTDHGAASQMFLVGGRVKPGVIGKHPSLTDLSQGDLKFHTDFRSVYATVLKQWLGVEPAEILGGKYPQLDLFKKSESENT